MHPVHRSGLFLLALLVTVATGAAAQGDHALERARRLLKSVPLIDGHNDLAWEIRQSKTAPMDVAERFRDLPGLVLLDRALTRVSVKQN